MQPKKGHTNQCCAISPLTTSAEAARNSRHQNWSPADTNVWSWTACFSNTQIGCSIAAFGVLERTNKLGYIAATTLVTPSEQDARVLAGHSEMKSEDIKLNCKAALQKYCADVPPGPELMKCAENNKNKEDVPSLCQTILEAQG